LLKSKQGLFIDGVDLEERLTDDNNFLYDYFIVNDVRGRGIIGEENTLTEVTDMDGAHASTSHTPVRPLEVDITVKSDTENGLHRKLERLDDILRRGTDLRIEFRDEEDRSYYGRLDAVDGVFPTDVVYQATLTFICPDPYKYGSEKEVDFEDDSTVVENNGTATAKPIFELTAKEKATFAMIANGEEEYNLIGEPAEVDTEVVDTRTLLLEERGQTLDTWTESGTEVDGTVDGTLGTDNDGITVPSYGAATNDWHGPALLKEVTPAQDFEVVAMVQGRTTSVSQTYRIEFYLFDENMNNLGKMAILDKNLNIFRKQAEGRVGPYVGDQINYPISSRNYSYDGWDFWYGMIRMRRIGNDFEFYVTRINNRNQHVYSLKETYKDVANEYAGRLKYVQIHIGKYADTDRAYAPKINYIRAYELKKVEEDQTSYILEKGDVVTFDHKNDDILVNGEARNDLKDFGGTFFTLKKGFNTIVVSPEDTFETKVRFRERWR